MGALAFLLTLLALPAPVAALESVFADGFESGVIDLEAWNPQVYDVVEGATLVSAPSGAPVRNGQYALRIKLEPTDLDPSGKSRSELRPRSRPDELAYRAGFGVPHVYTFSLFLPSDWQADAPEIVAQWHGKPDENAAGEAIEPLRSPPLALRTTYLEQPPLSGNFVPAWNVVAHWDASPQTAEDGSSVHLVTLLPPTDASPDLGQWVDWRFEVTWDWNPEGSGSVRVIKNGQPIAHYAGPNAFRDDQGPNSKIGLYKWTWPTSVDLRVAFYDEIRIERDTTALSALGHAARLLLPGLLLLAALGHFRNKNRRLACRNGAPVPSSGVEADTDTPEDGP
ncbi:MAG: polysaccharide lyase [Myxococcota bacterium]|nr:polysaccharide lyase [Myxococcota bacterium]